MQRAKRWLWLVGLLLITAWLGWAAFHVTSLEPSERADASSYWQFVLAAVTLLIMIAAPVKKAFTPAAPLPLDEEANLLAMAMRGQWRKAAVDQRLLGSLLPIQWRRSSQQGADPLDQGRFKPLPGLAPTTGGQLQEGTVRTLHDVYGGIASGRLVIIGAAGTGKSAAAILLLLNALDFREQTRGEQDRQRIPVPVLLNLHGWSSTTSVEDWLVGKLSEIPLFRGRARVARSLLNAGRIAVILDGLDEIPPRLRPKVLQALSDQAMFRLVLLSRTTEFVRATNGGPLLGAAVLEIQSIAGRTAANYIREHLAGRPSVAWQAILDDLNCQAGSPLAHALNNPLAISLLRDSYHSGDPVDELLDDSRFPTATAIENHLLDHAVTAAYTPRPGQREPSYTVDTAQRALRYLATWMNTIHTRDLAWWHITHRDDGLLRLITMVGAGLIAGLAVGLVFGPGLGIGIGLLVEFLVGFIGKHLQGKPSTPLRIHLIPPRRHVPRALTVALMFGSFWGWWIGWAAGLPFGLVLGLMASVLGWLTYGLASPMRADESTLDPKAVWRHDRNAGLVAALIAAIAVGLFGGLWQGPDIGLKAGLALGFVAWLTSGLEGGPGSAVLPTAIASARLAINREVPLRLIAFLEDARSRHLLHTVGPVYQFRHAKLQDRLARHHDAQAQ